MKAINWILLVLTAAAVGLCAFAGYRCMSFPTEDYARQAAALSAEAKTVKDDTLALAARLEEQEAALRSDLSRMGEDGAQAQSLLARLEEEELEKRSQLSSLRERADLLEHLYDRTLALRDEYAGKIRQLEDMVNAGETDIKICYWTFDDGPAAMTPAILDYCAENGVYVTFFTSREANESGKGDVDEPEVLRREIMGGHSVQNHSNSHQYAKYGNLYGMGIDSFREQVKLQSDWIYECTGFRPDIFRFPGGHAHACTLLPEASMDQVLAELGYVWIDWSCDVMDNLHANPNPATVYGRAWYQVRQMNIAVVLSHDWNGNTFEGFKRSVSALRDIGYVFLPLFSQSWTIGNTEILFW